MCFCLVESVYWLLFHYLLTETYLYHLFTSSVHPLDSIAGLLNLSLLYHLWISASFLLFTWHFTLLLFRIFVTEVCRYDTFEIITPVKCIFSVCVCHCNIAPRCVDTRGQCCALVDWKEHHIINTWFLIYTKF